MFDEEFKFYADGSNLHSWGKTGYNRPGGNFTLGDFGIVLTPRPTPPMEHDHAYKLLFSHPQMVADLLRGFVREAWVQQLDFSTLEPVSGHYVSDDWRAFTVWLRRVLLSSRLPGVELPQVVDLMEMKAMLAERVQEWTRKWKQEGMEEGRQQGRQEGRQEGLQKGQAELLVKILERQFGPLPPVYQQRILTAGPDDIWRWVEQALIATALGQVFD